jgi:hypothetical protein
MNYEKDDWPELFKWQKTYRKEHNLTPSEFLRAIDLPVCVSFIHYITGKDDTTYTFEKYIPSNREGSSGRKLRDAIFTAKTTNTVKFVSRTAEEIFLDYIDDNEGKIMSYGFVSFGIEKIENDVIDIIVSCKYRNSADTVREVLSDIKGVKIGKITVEHYVFYDI